MNSTYKKGDLVWVPSDITLLQIDENKGTVLRWTKTSKPTNVLVLDGQSGPYYPILFGGERWSAREIDLYEATSASDGEEVLIG
jgi:hypothetical protein